jgi:hypothetical protein
MALALMRRSRPVALLKKGCRSGSSSVDVTSCVAPGRVAHLFLGVGRTSCRWELSRLLNSIRGRQSQLAPGHAPGAAVMQPDGACDLRHAGQPPRRVRRCRRLCHARRWPCRRGFDGRIVEAVAVQVIGTAQGKYLLAAPSLRALPADRAEPPRPSPAMNSAERRRPTTGPREPKTASATTA